MLKRVTLVAGWAVIGAALGYGVLYLFTPLGLAIVVAALVIARAMPSVGASRLPEALGLVAGPGLACFTVAAAAANPQPWIAAGAAFVASALIAHLLLGRAVCARRAQP